MSWRKAITRTRPNQRNNSLFSRSVAPRSRNIVNNETHKDATEQISMHVRVLRYHEIRLGNIEKQLSNIARQLSNLGTPVSNVSTTTNSSANNVTRNIKKNETVTQLQDILKNLAQEVSTSNKMIKDFITGGNTHTPVSSNSTIVSKVSNTSENKKVTAMDSLKNISYKKVEVKSSPVEKHRTREWKLAKSRLVACGISATEERIQDMVLTMREEAGLVNDIVINRQEKIERDTHVLEETIVNIVDYSNNSDTEEQEKEQEKVESYDLAKSVNEGTVVLDIDVSKKEEASANISSDEELETVNVSTTEDIGYVPVHVVVSKKKKKRKNNKKE